MRRVQRSAPCCRRLPPATRRQWLTCCRLHPRSRSRESLSARRAPRRDDFFLAPIGHHVYAGDTALHLAAASHRPAIVQRLLAHGANALARNRRGAEPLHYAADGAPGHARWDPEGQSRVIEQLIAAGAAPDVRDRKRRDADASRRAHALPRRRYERCWPRVRMHAFPTARVRRRCIWRCRTPGEGGAGPPKRARSSARSSGSSSNMAPAPIDRDGAGRTVRERARSPWIRELLA